MAVLHHVDHPSPTNIPLKTVREVLARMVLWNMHDTLTLSNARYSITLLYGTLVLPMTISCLIVHTK